MASFSEYSLAELGDLRAEVKKLAGTGSTLREAARSVLDRLYTEFAESLVLTRLFATIPLGFLPEREKAFVRHLSSEKQALHELTDDTIVLVLLATRGSKPEWNNPGSSRRRLAIPLLSADFLRTVPLVGRLLGGCMRELPWLRKQKTLIVNDRMGPMSSLLYIENARTGKTSEGRQVIPAQDFIETHDIRTVLAMGGGYLNGIFICMVLFTREQIEREHSKKFAPLINTIKTATMDAVMGGKIL